MVSVWFPYRFRYVSHVVLLLIVGFPMAVCSLLFDGFLWWFHNGMLSRVAAHCAFHE